MCPTWTRFFIFHPKQTKCGIIYLREYTASAPGRKGVSMPNSNCDVEILTMFRQLTVKQQEFIVHFARQVLASEPAITSSGQASSPEHTA